MFSYPRPVNRFHPHVIKHARLSKVYNSRKNITSYYINTTHLRCEIITQEAYYQRIEFTENTKTVTASLLTSTDRHLVIRSCVLFLPRRQSSANCRGVSSSERYQPMAEPQHHAHRAPPTGKKGNSRSICYLQMMYQDVKPAAACYI